MVNTAELVKKMRRNCGHPLRELASRAATSAPALVDYEAGRHEPRLSTLERIAKASGCDLIVELRPRLTESESRSLALHESVAFHLRQRPREVVRLAHENIALMRSVDTEQHSKVYFDEWQRLLDGPTDVLIAVAVSTDQSSRDLRQCTPFAGVLSDDERLDVLRTSFEKWHR